MLEYYEGNQKVIYMSAEELRARYRGIDPDIDKPVMLRKTTIWDYLDFDLDEILLILATVLAGLGLLFGIWGLLQK